MKNTQNEKGQVLVLLTLGIITLLGFTALAIDGGRVYTEKRNVQGIADNSTLAGALYVVHDEGTMTSEDIANTEQVAINQALENGLSVDEIDVNVYKQGVYYYIETTLSSEVDPVIAQLVYNGELGVKAKSLARVLKLEYFAYGNALYSINDSACDALKFTGSGTIKISGTGIYSNSDCPTDAVSFEGGSSSVLTDSVSAPGGITTNGQVYNEDGTAFTDYNPGAAVLGDITVQEPGCDIPDGVRSEAAGEVTFTAGYYDSISENGHDNYTFEPGFYCIGNGFTTTNGNFYGNDVSFYVQSGNVSLSGNVEFIAPEREIAVDSNDYDWFGMLLHVGTGRFTLNGNSDSYYEGVVFVPTPANPSCKLNGSSDSDGFNMQLVCNTIEVKGDGELIINFDGSNTHIPPAKVDLVE